MTPGSGVGCTGYGGAVITVYTDGACSGNPGPGGWGWAVPNGPWASGCEGRSTNQRMELWAVLDALETLDGQIEVISDSTYVVNCFRDGWWKGWLQRGWVNKAKKPVANRDLWEPLIARYRERTDADPQAVQFTWVKGHSGDTWNDHVDALAVEAAKSQKGARGSTAIAGQTAGTAAKTASAAASSSATSTSSSTASADPTGREAPPGHLVVVAGHRPPAIGGYDLPNPTADAIIRQLGDILEAKASMHDDLVVLTGLQLGAEQLGADAAIDRGIPFIGVLAWPDPSAVWPKASQQRFDDLLDAATDVIILQNKLPESKAKMGGAMKRRDAWLARNAQEAIVVWDRSDAAIGATVRSFETGLGDDVWVIDPGDLTLR